MSRKPPAIPVRSIASPRTHFTREIYTGTELSYRSARPGAYDAMAFPSVILGHRVPAAQRGEPGSAADVTSTPPAAPAERAFDAPPPDNAPAL